MTNATHTYENPLNITWMGHDTMRRLCSRGDWLVGFDGNPVQYVGITSNDIFYYCSKPAEFEGMCELFDENEARRAAQANGEA